MADLWNLGDGIVPHCGNWQVRGVPNADQSAIIAGGGTVEAMWYGPMQQQPYRSTGDQAEADSVLTRIKSYLPKMAAIRMPFNSHSWGTYGSAYEGSAFDLGMHTFAQAARNVGVPLHWCLMDGESQRSTAEHPYPATGATASILAYLDAMSVRQIAAHQKLKDWYAANPTAAPVAWAYEAINEPDGYNVLGARLGDMQRAYAIYAQHCVAIYDAVYDGYDEDAWFFVGGWNYSANFHVLTAPNAYLGGLSPLAHIRAHVPADRLCWSMHAYCDWIGGRTQADVRRNFRRRLGGKAPEGIEGERIQMTEMNVQHDVVFRYPYGDSTPTMIGFLRNAQWFAEMGIGMGWWTAGNYAQARLIQVQGGSSLTAVRQEEGWSNAGFHHFLAARNNAATDQNGEVGLALDRGITEWRFVGAGDERDELGGVGIAPGINRATQGYAGRGTCVARGIANAANYLYGGDGWSALIGGPAPCIEFFGMGRGGGVARSPGAMRAIFFGSTHSPSRFYLPPGKSFVALVDGVNNPTTIVIDPASATTNVIDGFDAARGDRVSFRGAFADSGALRAAMTISMAGNSGTSWVEDAVVALPGGGTVRFVGAYNLVHTLYDACLDFTAGWYGVGWSEPADYDPAALDDPAPPSISFDPLLHDDEIEDLPPETGGGTIAILDGLGGAIVVRDGLGQAISVF